MVMNSETAPHVVVIGGGPAGLYAAETAARQGARVSLYEAKASVGRKLLVAGRGGLNLTHADAPEVFVTRYRGAQMPDGWWARCLAEFSPEMLRDWAAGLGIETFAQRTGRIYPREMKAAPLLRRWVERLRALEVKMLVKHRLVAMQPGALAELVFQSPAGEVRVAADAVILALGGASWAITGSDGKWSEMVENIGVSVRPWQAANCGWEVAWPDELVPRIEGMPLKNCAARASSEAVTGELMLTSYGLEGGIIYQLGPELRAMDSPELCIDLKPDQSAEQLQRKMESVRKNLLQETAVRWRLTTASHALLAWRAQREGVSDLTDLTRLVKQLRVPLLRPRPIDEAISSAGGVAWREVADDLSLLHAPNVFVAGEMLDWEAPTGGYLMQGCFASARWAARGALAFCAKARNIHR
jgi:uncharacterized flavoprotein (TIGR03862 family)